MPQLSLNFKMHRSQTTFTVGSAVLLVLIGNNICDLLPHLSINQQILTSIKCTRLNNAKGDGELTKARFYSHQIKSIETARQNIH